MCGSSTRLESCLAYTANQLKGANVTAYQAAGVPLHLDRAYALQQTLPAVSTLTLYLFANGLLALQTAHRLTPTTAADISEPGTISISAGLYCNSHPTSRGVF